MNLEEFRQKFPQYNEYDDTQLANALYKKHYADKLEFGEFAQRIGYTAPEAVAPKAPAPPPSSETFPLLRQVADVPLKVGAGVVTGVRMIADAFGADTGVGKTLRGVEDYIADLYSAQSKKDSQEIGRIMKDAEDKGVLDQVVAGAKAFSVAPVDMLSNALGTAAPAIAASLAATLGGAPVLAARAATLGIGAMMGSGTVKGAIYDATKSALKENTDLSADEIEMRAVAAQEYGGKNLDQILMGTALGAAGSVSGVEPLLARQLAKGIASKEAVKDAIKKAAATDTALAAERGMIKQGAITGGKEFATEFPQGAQEQLAQNIALQREGFDVPTMRGVVGQGTLEGLAGLGMGAVTGGREASSAARELAGEKVLGQTEEQQKISDETLKDAFTPAKDLARKAGKGFNQEAADLLMPASTAAGQALVEGVTRPDITDIPPPADETKTKSTRAPKITAEGVTPESIQAANDYVGKIDSGEKIKQSEYRQIARSVGLSIPVGKSNAEAVELIRNHLAQQGAPDVTGIDTQAGGAGAGVATLANQSQTAAGVAGPQPGGVVSTGTNVGANLAGAKQQPFALSSIVQMQIKKSLEEGDTPNEIIGSFNAPDLKTEVGEYIKSLTQGTSNKFPTLTRGSVTPDAVRALTNEQLNTELNNINLKDAEHELVKTELAQRQQGTTSGTTTSQAKQATPQGQAKPAAGTVSLGDLTPDIQDQILTRRNDIYELEADGAPQNKIAAAYRGLNILEESLGLELTKPSTLSAKKDNRFVDVRKDILGQGKQATATEQNLTPAYEGQDLQGAIKLGEKYENETEAERERAYKESLGEGEAVYRAEQDIKQTEAEKEAGITLKSGAVSQENRDNYDKVREEFPDLPEWRKLDSVDKDVYFENIRYGNMPEHRKAAQALIAYLKQTGGRDKGYGQGTTGANVQRAIKNYEDNRATSSKLFNVQFPRWGDLSQDVKDIFLGELGKGTGRTMNLAGAQQDMAFAKAGEALKIEQSEASSVQKQKELDNIKKRQEEVQKEAEKNKAELDKLRSDFNRLVASGVPGTYLPSNIIQMIRGNNLPGVLQFLRSKYETFTAKDKIFRSVAQALFEMKLDTKIFYADSLSNGDLAQYDPVEDTIYVTAQGMTASTVLHEIVHAATAKIVNLYTTRQFKQLTEAQLRAVEHLNDLMYETAGRLAGRHPEAYEVVGKDSEGNPRYSLMEFLAYALTKDTLQIDLATLQPKKSAAVDRLLLPEGAVVTNLPESKSMWSELGRTIAKIIGLDKVYFRKNKVREDAPYNYLLEIASSFNEILAKPTEPIFLSPFSAKASTDKVEPKGLDPNAKEYQMSEKENPTRRSKTLYKTLTTRQGWRTVARNVQDRGYFSRSLFAKQDRAGNIERDKTKGADNWDEERDLSVGKAKNYVTAELQKPMDDLRTTFQAYLKASGYKFEQAMSLLQQISEMRHEPERRHVNWVLGVPLSADKNLVHNGKPISAAQRRIDILGDPRNGTEGLIHKVELTKAQQAALFQELEILAKAPKDGGHADPLGDTPRAESYEEIKKKYDAQGADAKGYSIDENNVIYNALGLDKVDIDKRLEDYTSIPVEQRELIEQMFAQAKIISDATMKMDKIGNYWSTPVSNLVGMYNYQNYMPFKGISKTLVDEMSDLNSEVNGAELQDTPHAADGRFTPADNPFLRLLNDAYRSAARAGRKDYTLAIRNAVLKGLIPGEIVDKIAFAQRNIANLAKYKGANSTYLFHYNEDGSIEIIKINDINVLRALRYSFRDASPMLEMANAVTGFFGAQHTRYNYNFAPLNFVRDALTNAWNIGASRQLGPAKALSYIANISTQVAKNGLGKAMEVALLHEKGDPASMRILEQRAKNDPYTRDLLEYIRVGGKTVYMEGFSLSSNLQALNKGLNQSRIVATYEGFTRLIDSWNNMFEFSSRAVAYSMYKQEALKKNIANGMSDKRGPEGQMSPAEEAAATEAAAFVKNLANFEKVGEYGRELGAAYMFIRPSATGAVRAIEAVLPAFTSEAQERADMPPQIAKDEAAAERYMESFRQDRKNAQRMITALIGGGVFLWTMSMMMSPDDEWERNSTKSDNMQQWTRFARFHIPNEVSELLGLGKDVVFQIPWGFGLGAFAAIGAQICGIGFGNTTFKEGMGNIVSSILADSFLPLPISKIEVTESPMKWAVDSIMPTVFRPVVEYLMNTNGVGQAINSATTRRLGEAFTGGDRIPEVYKTLSKDMYRQSLGAIDMSPNTLYFFTNSYLDGISKMFLELPYSLTDLAQGEKTFNPKTDVPLFGSFFGAKTNVDSREYGKMEVKIKELSQRLTTLEADSPELYAEYVSKNPLVPKIVDIYQERQGDLNELRQKASELRNMKYLSPKDRDSLLKITTMEQNFLKHMMTEDFKAYGLER